MILRALTLSLLLASSAEAAQSPKPGLADPRIASIVYDPWKVVSLTASPGTALQVLFGPGETIRHVALGDSANWEVAVEGDSLFLKPKIPTSTTNMIVTTQGAAQMRHYTFELTARRSERSTGLYVLRFHYPQEDKQKLAAALHAQAEVLETRLTGLQLDQAALQGKRNLAYGAQGASALQPSEISDNGAYTVLRFPGHQALPAIYQVDDAGVESLASYDVRGELVVLHGVSRQLRLRRGRQVLCLYNQAYDPYGARSPSRSAAIEVERTDKTPAHE